MPERSFSVQCDWDPEAQCWIASSNEVPGLATGADSFEELVEKLRIVVPELLEANGSLPPGEGGDVTIAIHAERHELIRHAA